jgi:RimJ/RimL family protein N-acetyltransferase
MTAAMMPGGDVAIRTPRTILRQWREADRELFARLNADPAVMEHFPATLDRAQSDAMVARLTEHITRHGFGFWALEIPGVAACAGFVGMVHVSFDAAFVPAVEIGWRLARACWGQGYATESARAAARFGFTELALAEIVAFAVPDNSRSRAVMARIGMRHDADGDFEHPRIPAGHRLRRHVLYRLTADELR